MKFLHLSCGCVKVNQKVSMSGYLWIICFSLAAVFSSVNMEPIKETPPRSLVNLAEMIILNGGLNPFDYTYYGRYCGFGGGKGEPVDETDSCCRIHDDCYDVLLKQKCNPYEVQYVIFHNKSSVDCGKNESYCAYEACQCDLTIAKCFHKAPYNEANMTLKQILKSIQHAVREFSKIAKPSQKRLIRIQ